MKTKKDRIEFQPRVIDKAIFAALGFVVFLSGLYLIGPWYIDITALGNKAPIIHLVGNLYAVKIYAILLVLDGLALFYASAGRGVFYTRIVANALLAGFLLRLYSLIGVFLTLESWRPPGYLSQVAVVMLLGAMWVWVRVSERPTQ